MLLSTDVRKEGRRGDREYTSKEITRPAISTSSGCGVRTVGANHVINGCHVNAVICDTHDGREDARCNPWYRWTSGAPCESDEADWEAGCCEEEPPKSGLVLRFLIIRMLFAVFLVSTDGWDEHKVSDQVADQDWDE